MSKEIKLVLTELVGQCRNLLHSKAETRDLIG